MVDDFSKKIDIGDSQMVLQYGAAAQKSVASFSESALNAVRTKDLGEVGDTLSNLVVELKGFGEEEEKGGIFGFFKKTSNKLEVMKAQYGKAEANVEKIARSLEQHQVTLMKDIAMFDQMYELNLKYYKELTMYIIAGKKRLAEVQSTQLEELRKKAEATLMEAIDEAEYLGAKGIAFLAGKWEEATKDEAYQQLLKTTRNVCDYAAKKGMNVELEVFDFDMDKAALIGPAPYAAKFAADMRTTHSNFGLLVDLSHFPTTYETSKFVIRTLRPYITHFHFGNAVVKPGYDGYGDLHPRMGYPDSANDTPELLDYLRVLKQEGFFDAEKPYVLSMEVTLRPGEDEDIVLANTKRVLNRAWALLED